jgi:hypothetical protein
MIIWNRQHGWPTLAHTLGHLGAPGGDHDAGKDDHFTLMWPLSLIGAQLGAVGVPALLAMGSACAWAWRARRTDPDRWPARLWLICCSVPAVAFFVVLSFFKPVLGGWPFPSYVPLVALVAEMAAPEFGRANRTFIYIRNVAVVYGLIGWLVLSFPSFLTALPVVGANFEKSVMKRLAGHRENARQIQALIEANRDDQGRPPPVITRYYMDAALDAFYLPGHPNVYNAGTLTGQRPTLTTSGWRMTSHLRRCLGATPSSTDIPPPDRGTASFDSNRSYGSITRIDSSAADTEEWCGINRGGVMVLRARAPARRVRVLCAQRPFAWWRNRPGLFAYCRRAPGGV